MEEVLSTMEAYELAEQAKELKQQNAKLKELLADIEYHLSGGAALHPHALIFADDAPAIEVIRAALK